MDKNLLIRKFNPVAMRQININESDIGRPLADISTNIKFSSLIEDIMVVINSQLNSEKHIETTDGKWYSMMIVPYIRSQDKKTNGAIINFHDITAITRSKKIIEATNRRLLKIVEDHDTFIYSASHGLKAPLNNMEGLLSILQNSEDLIEIKAVTIPLIKSVIRLKETIDELSHITRIEDDTENTEKVNLEVLLEEVTQSLNDSILKSKAKFKIDLKEKEIKFSKKNLRSILLNLLNNSIKYRSKERPLEVEIKSRRKEGSIVLSFQDNGIGISKDKIEQIFTKFKRVHDSETDVEGSGIGLFLVKKIITNAGGEIEVSSIRGKGSCFTVYFKD
ncbi:MAG: ATP-binding protein [Bacteroidota bacterium]|nr:ATP-binding protein [Bacteroidota bacterium]